MCRCLLQGSRPIGSVRFLRSWRWSPETSSRCPWRGRVRAGHSPVALGESVELSWDFAGRFDKVRDLKLQLEGREERDEGSGKRRRTHTDVFYTADIAQFTNVNDVKSGTVLCTIPADHSPSDSDGAHRVIWVIRLKAQVEMGADLNDEYPITVEPLPVPGANS